MVGRSVLTLERFRIDLEVAQILTTCREYTTNEKIERLMEDRLGPIRFEDLEIPLAVVASDLTTGRKAVFS